MIERVTEAATVEVGRMYMVPCAPFFPRLNEPARGGIVPVVGPDHSDMEIIEFPWRHYHYDWRFMSWREVSLASPRAGREGEPLTPFALAYVNYALNEAPIQWLRRRCRRLLPDFPIIDRFAVSLEAAFSSHLLKPDCRTCPHRGIPLNGLPVIDGKVVCPGHGLQWDLTTGALVPRVTP